MKVFISQPMAGLEEKDVIEVRNAICERFHIIEDELIENFIKDVIPEKDVNKSVWCLGDSIRLMSFADIVIFAHEWEYARGCKVEHDICVKYHIPFIEL